MQAWQGSRALWREGASGAEHGGLKAHAVSGCAGAGLAIAEPTRWRQGAPQRPAAGREMARHRRQNVPADDGVAGIVTPLSLIRDAKAASRVGAACYPRWKFSFCEKKRKCAVTGLWWRSQPCANVFLRQAASVPGPLWSGGNIRSRIGLTRVDQCARPKRSEKLTSKRSI